MVVSTQYLVAGAAALAVLEDGLVAARRHGGEGVLVGVLEAARAAWQKIQISEPRHDNGMGVSRIAKLFAHGGEPGA